MICEATERKVYKWKIENIKTGIIFIISDSRESNSLL
jgi:hypothetical protein